MDELPTTSTESEVQSIDVSIYPNPTDGIIYLDAFKEKATRLEVISTTGQIIYTNAIDKASKIVDLSSMDSGLYIIKLYDGENAVGLGKVVKI